MYSTILIFLPLLRYRARLAAAMELATEFKNERGSDERAGCSGVRECWLCQFICCRAEIKRIAITFGIAEKGAGVICAIWRRQRIAASRTRLPARKQQLQPDLPTAQRAQRPAAPLVCWMTSASHLRLSFRVGCQGYVLAPVVAVRCTRALAALPRCGAHDAAAPAPATSKNDHHKRPATTCLPHTTDSVH